MNRSFQSAPTWSCHRDQQLQACERKYFFQYLSDARLNSPDPWIRGIALLKKLKNISMWQGECVHLAIAEFLSATRQGKRLSGDELKWSLRQRMKRDWKFSEARRFRQEPSAIGKLGTALFEHEYDEIPAETQFDPLADKSSLLLERFFEWTQANEDLLDEVKLAERIWIEPPAWGVDAPGFMMGDVQVITKVDLALQKQNGDFAIYDWKTGKVPRATLEPSQNDVQVSVYMLWASLGLEVPLERVSSSLVYLGGDSATEIKFDLDEERSIETLKLIEDSVSLAQQWDGNFKSGRMSLDDLDYASSLEECRRCNFKRVCRASIS